MVASLEEGIKGAVAINHPIFSRVGHLIQVCPVDGRTQITILVMKNNIPAAVGMIRWAYGINALLRLLSREEPGNIRIKMTILLVIILAKFAIIVILTVAKAFRPVLAILRIRQLQL